MKKLILSPLLLCLFLLSSCDSGSDGPVSSCASDQDLIDSDCPAETLADICEPFFCGSTGGDPPMSADFFLPFPELSCSAFDCFTLQCGDTFYSVNVEESEQPGVVLLSGLVNGEQEYFCFTREPVSSP
ncbi:MAG TPA: hypothetical protein PKC29_13720 [Thermodesulfobacteriota bacterium]|nr:hypothetical protein [Thermodesulfobacteriota bacterium]